MAIDIRLLLANKEEINRKQLELRISRWIKRGVETRDCELPFHTPCYHRFDSRTHLSFPLKMFFLFLLFVSRSIRCDVVHFEVEQVCALRGIRGNSFR